ncbi:LPXTG cell wall anchor domain-containing protein [Streptacidiphilus sp. EB129]|uniref:LPXTG cell wall anchor domain-containing protein n=1 Tax=Streptacidiphilus sp. EB129 TaxID=3156262 RepID=UPI003511841B
MRLRRTSSVAAVAALGSLALLGMAPSAFAAAPTSVTKVTCPKPSTDLGVTLTGLTNTKLTAGGTAATGSVSLVNNSGEKLTNVVTFLETGLGAAPTASSALTVEEYVNGKWQALTYHVDADGNSFVVLGTTPTLAPKGKDGGQFRVVAPKGAPLGAYVGLAISGTVQAGTAVTPKDLGNLSTGTMGNATPMTPAACTTHVGFDHHDFTVVKAAGTPTPAPSPTHATPSSAPTSAAPSASSTGPALASTGGGSNSGMIAGVAGALVLAGGAGVVVARRRKGAHN